VYVYWCCVHCCLLLVYTHLICFSLKIHLSLIFTCLTYCLYLIGMELTDDNLRTLSDYLQHTLSPDVNIRRPGEFNLLSWTFLVSICLFLVSSQLFCMIMVSFLFVQLRSFLNQLKLIRTTLFFCYTWLTNKMST
jgi:hypothetical protein